MKKSFDNKKYIKLQSDRILERVNQFDGKLYMEIGGKIFDDYHAARVFKGFEKDSKVKVLLSLKKKVEMVLIINANDIQGSKVRGDLGITYEDDIKTQTDEDVLINTTPCGMFPNIGGSAICIEQFQNLSAVVDAIYNPLNSYLVLKAREKGIKAVGGLYMLIAQAVFAAEKFTDC